MNIKSIMAKIQVGDEACKKLTTLGKIGYIDFVADNFKSAAAERYYDIIGEVISDVSYYICVVKLNKVSHSVTMALDLMLKNELIIKSVRDSAVLLYNFRNKITHNYQEVSVKEIHEGIAKACSTYKNFIADVLKYL